MVTQRKDRTLMTKIPGYVPQSQGSHGDGEGVLNSILLVLQGNKFYQLQDLTPAKGLRKENANT
jgi:hypothetical protein